MKTIEDNITAVQSAIDAIENGAQSYDIGELHVTRASLKELYARLKELKTQYARKSNSYQTRVFVAFK
jgi:acetylglutamate kinase